MLFGEATEGQDVGLGADQHVSGVTEALGELLDDAGVLEVDLLGIGLLEVERMRVATMDWVALGTLVNTLRTKWTRQRCQAAPGSTEAMASTRPPWASETTSWTPLRPRATSPRRTPSSPPRPRW